MKVTGEQLKAAALAANIRKIDHHECGLCGVMVHYYVEGESLFFDPSCACTYGSGPRQESWDEAAAWVNMQTDDAIAARIAASFGLQPTPDASPSASLASANP